MSSNMVLGGIYHKKIQSYWSFIVYQYHDKTKSWLWKLKQEKWKLNDDIRLTWMIPENQLPFSIIADKDTREYMLPAQTPSFLNNTPHHLSGHHSWVDNKELSPTQIIVFLGSNSLTSDGQLLSSSYILPFWSWDQGSNLTCYQSGRHFWYAAPLESAKKKKKTIPQVHWSLVSEIW